MRLRFRKLAMRGGKGEERGLLLLPLVAISPFSVAGDAHGGQGEGDFPLPSLRCRSFRLHSRASCARCGNFNTGIPFFKMSLNAPKGG